MSTSHPSDPETEVPHLTESFSNGSNNLKFSSSCIGGELGDGISPKPNNNQEAKATATATATAMAAAAAPSQKVPMAVKATNHCSSQSDEFVGSQVLDFKATKNNFTTTLSMEEASDPEFMHPSNNSTNIGNNDNAIVNPNLQFHQWDPGGASIHFHQWDPGGTSVQFHQWDPGGTSNQSSFPGEIPEPQVLWDPGGPRDQFSSQNQSVSSFNSLSSCCGESFNHTCPSLDWAKGSDKPGLLASGLLVA